MHFLLENERTASVLCIAHLYITILARPRVLLAHKAMCVCRSSPKLMRPALFLREVGNTGLQGSNVFAKHICLETTVLRGKFAFLFDPEFLFLFNEETLYIGKFSLRIHFELFVGPCQDFMFIHSIHDMTSFCLDR